MNLDRDYYIQAITEEFPADGLSDGLYFNLVNEAILEKLLEMLSKGIK